MFFLLSPSCYTIDALLKEYFQEAQTDSHLLMETRFRLKGELSAPQISTFDNPGFLSDTEMTFSHCLTYSKNKVHITDPVYLAKCARKYPRTFFHYGDIGNQLLDLNRVTLLKYNKSVWRNYFESIYNFSCSHRLNSQRKFKKFVDLFIYSINFKEDYIAFTGYDITLGNIYRDFEVADYLRRYPTGPHKIAKQIMSLNPEDRRTLLAYYEKNWEFKDSIFRRGMSYQEIRDNACYDRNNETFREHLSNYYDDIRYVLRNIYAIARSLKIIENYKSDELIYYWGNEHIQDFIKFYKEEPGTKEVQVSSYQKSLRCLKFF